MEPRIHWAGPYEYPGAKRRLREYTEVSVPPGQSPDPWLARIEAESRKVAGLGIRERISSGVTSSSPYPTSVTEIMKRVCAAVRPGVPFGPDPGFGGTTTSNYFRQRGIPAYGFAPILMNVFDSARRHGNDERVFLRDYLNGVDVYDQVVKEYAFFPDNKTSRRGTQK